jgi:saccharopine dehydrogenase (NAD+, L-lysine-forming)
MTHIWIRAEERPNEQRVGVTPDGVAELLRAGFQVTLEEDPSRAIPWRITKGAAWPRRDPGATPLKTQLSLD